MGSLKYTLTGDQRGNQDRIAAWKASRGYWIEEARISTWLLTIGLLTLAVIQLAVQYRVNVWNRDLFNAIEKKDGQDTFSQAIVFLPQGPHQAAKALAP